MKKLVKKIALPGAILAFAMALFGVSAYAGQQWNSWHDIKNQHISGIQQDIENLSRRIKDLKGDLGRLQKEKEDAEAQRDSLRAQNEGSISQEQLNNKIKDIENSQINPLKAQLEAAIKDKQTLQDQLTQMQQNQPSEDYMSRHNGEMEDANKVISDLHQKSQDAVRDAQQQQ